MTFDQGEVATRLEALEQISRTLEPDADRRRDWREAVAAFSESFVEDLPDSPAYGRDEGPGDPAAELAVAESAQSVSSLLETYRRQVIELHLNPASPRFFGYIPGGGVYPAALGDFLAAVTNRYSGVFFASPGAARIENALVRWIAGILGLPASAGGSLTSGGSLANLSAVVTAREEVPFGERPRAVAYLSAEVHHSVLKALRIAGMGEAVLRTVPVDARFRMVPPELVRQVEADRAAGLRPWLLVSTAGTVNTGAIDPLSALSDVAERFGLWHHIDAAYGGFFVLTDECRPALAGIERGDSIAVDPHKGLFLPYGCGCLVVRDHRKLLGAHRQAADYMQDTFTPPDEVSPADYSPELTRHFRGLRLWLPLRLFGLGPFRAALEEKVLLARWFYAELERIDGIERGPEPELSVVAFRFRPPGVRPDQVDRLNELNLALAAKIRGGGRVFLSTTKLSGREIGAGAVFLRLAVLCFRSHLEHVREVLELLKRLAAGN